VLDKLPPPLRERVSAAIEDMANRRWTTPRSDWQQLFDSGTKPGVDAADFGLPYFNFGGQGHPLAYDKVLVDQVNKMMKPFGGRVEDVGEAYVPWTGKDITGSNVPPNIKTAAPQIIDESMFPVPIKGVKLTREMKKLIREKGFYALGPLMAAILGGQAAGFGGGGREEQY
jgi:hypothetical protein